MKTKLLITIFLLSLCPNIYPQYSKDENTNYVSKIEQNNQFRYGLTHDLINIEIEPYDPLDNMRLNFDNPTIKPTLILIATFLTNQFIINHNEQQANSKYISQKTSTVFLIGMAACTLTFAFEIKRIKKKQIKLSQFQNLKKL